jgi:hypothetical protein
MNLLHECRIGFQFVILSPSDCHSERSEESRFLRREGLRVTVSEHRHFFLTKRP